MLLLLVRLELDVMAVNVTTLAGIERQDARDGDNRHALSTTVVTVTKGQLRHGITPGLVHHE